MEKTDALERLFDLISSEQVILFAGAGLSLYAGYPSGNVLRDYLYNKLGDQTKQLTPSTISLADLAQKIFNITFSQNSLTTDLKNKFLAPATQSHVHATIAKIPHFKTIITTNYDQMFERAYGHDMEVLYKSSHIPVADPKKIHLYKIHGDLSDSKTIILKADDYSNFFNDENQNSVFWNTVKHLLASKYILFIGYSLEDPNIKFVFDRILKELEENKNETFFISPAITEEHKNTLIRRSINYIEGTGEEFFTQLLTYLEENLFIDLKKKKVSADTAYKLTSKLGYTISIGMNKASEYYLASIAKDHQPINGKVVFKTNNDPDFNRKISDYLGGKTRDVTFTIPKEEISGFSVMLDNFIVHNDEDIKSLELQKQPFFEDPIDIVFENGYELNDFHIRAYVFNEESNPVIELHTSAFTTVIKFSFGSNGARTSVTNTIKDIIPDVNSFLTYNELLRNISSGEKFSILVQGRSVYDGYTVLNKKTDENLPYEEYFNLLRKIERSHKFKFRNISSNEINDNSMYMIRRIVAKSEKKYLELPFNGEEATLSNNDLESLKKIQEKPHSLFWVYDNFEEVVVHNHPFQLGYRHAIVRDAIVKNLSHTKDKLGYKFNIISKNSKVLIYYSESKQFPTDLPN